MQTLAQNLATRYKASWTIWVTQRKIRVSDGVVLPDTIEQDIAEGSEGAYSLYSEAWSRFIGDIKTATTNTIQAAIFLQNWKAAQRGTSISNNAKGLGM